MRKVNAMFLPQTQDSLGIVSWMDKVLVRFGEIRKENSRRGSGF